MSDQPELIAQFIQVSGTDEDVARFYLTSSNWSLEGALNNFLGYQSEDAQAGVATGADTQAPSSSTSGAVRVGENEPEGFDKSSSAKPKIATLGDMSKRSSTEEEGQEAFYAGGSDRSGQQVLGPPKRKNFREQLTDMFRLAQEQNFAESPANAPSTSGNRGTVWGQGVRLGMTANDHAVVTAQRDTNVEKKPVVVLKLWSQGFSIDDGELRLYDDPQNKEFLETVMRGEIPQELLEMGRMVNVDVEDHRHEDYKKKSMPATFKGSGHTLGSPVPNILIKDTAEGTTTEKPVDSAQNEANAREELNVNTGAPTTTLQIRLADGSRLTGQFNLTHTVSDIRRFIQSARPQYLNSNFVLVSAFPTRELSDEASTIETAGLKNAALMQRLK